MKSVRFLLPNPPYQLGEVAGFEDEVAKRLVQSGKAEYYKPPKAKNLEAPPEDKMVHKGEVKKK